MRQLDPRSFAGLVLVASIVAGIGSAIARSLALGPGDIVVGALFGLIFGGSAYIAIKALYCGADSGVLWWGRLRKR